MKFDLVEINRLSPSGLWDLGVLVSVISVLRRVIIAGACGGSVLVYGRLIVHFSETLRARTRDNLNIRIKAWVLQSPHRIAQVRRIIGEAAIRNWRTNRLADYALTKYFGDWKRKFPDGFAQGDNNPMRQSAPKFCGQIRAYNWKLFALVKIVNVQGFWYKKPTPESEDQDMRNTYAKLWNVDIMDKQAANIWNQPRPPRTLDPIRFTPDELEPEQGAKTSPPILAKQDTSKRIENAVEFTKNPNEPPPKREPP